MVQLVRGARQWFLTTWVWLECRSGACPCKNSNKDRAGILRVRLKSSVSRQAKLFKAYIELELQLGAVERVRKLYQKFLEWAPETCAAWCKFAELERDLNEKARTRRGPTLSPVMRP